MQEPSLWQIEMMRIHWVLHHWWVFVLILALGWLFIYLADCKE